MSFESIDYGDEPDQPGTGEGWRPVVVLAVVVLACVAIITSARWGPALIAWATR